MDQIAKMLSDVTEKYDEEELLHDIKNLQSGLLWFVNQVTNKGEDKIEAMQYLVYQLLYIRDMILVAYPSDIFISNEDEGELNLFKDE